MHNKLKKKPEDFDSQSVTEPKTNDLTQYLKTTCAIDLETCFPCTVYIVLTHMSSINPWTNK